MAYLYGSGNETVDQMINFGITGNVVPHAWYRSVLRENGKPHLLAISILSDIVYWYRPQEIRDEDTGHLLRYQKRFMGEKLQKTYESYAEFFGESRRTIKQAMDVLVSLGVVKRQFRSITTGGMTTCSNVMYLDLDVKKLRQITNPETGAVVDNLSTKEDEIDLSTIGKRKNCPQVDSEDSAKPAENKASQGGCKISYPLVQNNVPPGTKFCTTPYNKMYHPLQNNVTPPTEFCGTYTYNTTENTTKNTTETTNRNVYSVNQSVRPRTSLKEKLTLIDGLTDRQTDESEAYRRIIRQNIEYDHHMKYDDYGEKELYSEIYGIICEIVCIKRPTVRIEGQDLPYEVVKSRFLKLEENHVLYVMERMKATSTKINNIKAYLLTSLYNAPETINYYYQQDMQYDEYGEGSSRTREVRKNLLRKYGGAI